MLTYLQLLTISTINQVAMEKHFNSSTARTIAYYESTYQPEAIGSAGEVAVFQFKPKTWKWLSKKSGLKGNIKSTADQTRLFIWAYNHGYCHLWATCKFLKHLPIIHR